MPNYYWTKVWGGPGEPATEALLFSKKGARDSALKKVRRGDIVVYLTSDAAEADSMLRGRVCGAVEIAGAPVLAEDLDLPGRARDVDFNDRGDFRWPFGITIRRSWRVMDKEANDALIPGHRKLGLQGAATIHEMQPDEIARFQGLRVQQQVEGTSQPGQEIFAIAQNRPWMQKEGPQKAPYKVPGCDLYVAVIHDCHGMTFKVGSGKHEDRIDALNLFRRRSQGEATWSLLKGHLYGFHSPNAAQAAEYHIIEHARKRGFGTKDHSEFIAGIDMKDLAALFVEAVKVGIAKDAEFAGVRNDDAIEA
ncbi:hypothetical protein [Oceaniovalibus guishaninsula]|uniref:hypothetical protein n=1 Tax=Oceaniovalibus guishaninsula TaxID=1046117 RepID=UPI0012EA3F2C|nr:hypothetical protein [Oceaniovalibus guishaninsula]